ncbi:MAG: ATP-binding protein, partial [Candidatus Methylophosphatis roskildensis]
IYDVVHHMIPKLRPLALDRFGLADALDDLLGDWRLQHPQIEFSLKSDRLPEVLGEKLMTSVYRIIQESVNNALRHAQATRIAIELGVVDGDLTISVEDNGRGLPADWRTPGHYGVIGMRERAFTLGGTLDLQKPEGGGLRVFARIPLN